MKEKRTDRNPGGDKPVHQELFDRLEVPFTESGDAVWEQLSAKISPPAKVKPMRSFRIKLAAASVILLIGTAFFANTYQQSVRTGFGEQLSHRLPDGSVVDLNAGSTLSWRPYWWFMQREVHLTGEAFFTVEKGETFSVRSGNSTTEVLGTSFNVYARDRDYRVFCETGRVRVSSPGSSEALVIQPGEMAISDDGKPLIRIPQIQPVNAAGWKNNRFGFHAVALDKVIGEVERQYNVNIALDLSNPADYRYTGYFSKPASVDSALALICQPFALQPVKVNEDSFNIISDQ